MKWLILIPVLSLTLMACGQKSAKKDPLKQSGGGVKVLFQVSGQCRQLGGSGISNYELMGFEACPTADSTGVVIRYTTITSGTPFCVVPASGSGIFLDKNYCFTPQFAGDEGIRFPVSFNVVYVVKQEDLNEFIGGATGYGAGLPDYVWGQFR